MEPGQDGVGLGPDGWGTGEDAAAAWLTDDGGPDEAEFLPALAAIIPAVISAAPAIISAVQQLTSKPRPAAPPPAPPAPPPPRPAPQPAPPAPRPAVQVPLVRPVVAAPRVATPVLRPQPSVPRPPMTVPTTTVPTPVASPAPARGAPPTPPSPTAPVAAAPPAPAPAPDGAVDLLQQLAVLLPRIADLVTRREGREWLEGAERYPAGAASAHHPTSYVAHAPRTTGGFEATKATGPGDGSWDDDVSTGGQGDEAEGADASPGGSRGRGPPTPDGAPSEARAALPGATVLDVRVAPCPTALLVARVGAPRLLVTEDCRALTSAAWAARMVTAQVGQARVRGHRRAVALFAEAFEDLRCRHPGLYARVHPAGMLCVRHVRGRPDVLSPHALGLALDVTLDGRAEVVGVVPHELAVLQDVLGRSGIFWGAALRPEDAMHFEVGSEVVHRWLDEGTF